MSSQKMQTVANLQELEEYKQNCEALLVVFGGTNCNVCHSVTPKLSAMVEEKYPKIQQVYVNCHETTEICSQNGIFSLPVVQIYFTGQKFIEEVRSFSLPALVNEIERPYRMLFSEV